jgi:hypothetical protein
VFAEIPAVDVLVPAAVVGRLADEVFDDLGRGFRAVDGRTETVGLGRLVFEEEFALSLCDGFLASVFGPSSSETFR